MDIGGSLKKVGAVFILHLKRFVIYSKRTEVCVLMVKYTIYELSARSGMSYTGEEN